MNNAPAIFVTIPKQTPDWAILDAGAFMQSLLLAATAKGLGSIPTYNSVRYPQVVRQVLGSCNRAAPGRGRARLRKLGQGHAFGSAPGPQ
ncbi:nitroreductase family protein [Limosilactobacillus fermentum]